MVRFSDGLHGHEAATPTGGGRSSRRPRAANTGKVARVQYKADTRMAYATGVSLHTAQADAPALSLHFLIL